MELLKRYCTRVAWLSDGKIVAAGPSDQIIARYLEAQG
jgi:ABC-type polysaccharide/polyol phosphate transport system ATPase subunit